MDKISRRDRDKIEPNQKTRVERETDKAGIFKAEDGFYFLRKKFIMKSSGKIIIRLHPKALAEER